MQDMISFTSPRVHQMKIVRLILLLLSLLILASCDQISTDATVDINNRQGISELNSGQYAKAITSFEKALEYKKISRESRGKILRNIALTYDEMQQKNSAANYYNLAANCYDKDSYWYLVNISDVEILRGKIADAIPILQKAVKIKPNEIGANNTLGLIYIGDYGANFADPKKAFPYNEKAFQINKDRITESVLARNYYKLGQYENAERHFENLTKKYPDVVVNWVSLGMVKFKQNKQQEARELWNIAENKDPKYHDMIENFIKKYE
jgi:tetratricopeptide (TPR) repeat protein